MAHSSSVQYVKIVSPIKLPVLQEVSVDSSINESLGIRPQSSRTLRNFKTERCSDPEVVKTMVEGQQEQEQNKENEVNCLFCYQPINDFNVDKIWRGGTGARIMRKTAQRLLEYIGNHLSIEVPQEGCRLKNRRPKEKRLLPHNLPLCLKCSNNYYRGVYDTFVEYENAMAKLNSQIGSCVTKIIAVSSRDNEKSVEDLLMISPDTMEHHNPKEHQVMVEVRKFRAQVLEKNPGGYKDKNNETDVRQRKRPQSTSSSTTSDFKEIKSSTELSPEEPVPSSSSSPVTNPVPTNLNIIKIVKKREVGPDKFEHLSGQLMGNNDVDEDDEDEEIIEIPNGSKPLSSYAVSNPAPGIIQIIPVNVLDKSKKKKKRPRREAGYAEQRRRIYTCKFCNEYFPGQAKLNFHQVKVHGAEKPIQCEKCDHRCIDKASLKQHMITHMDKSEKEQYKKFFCHLCPAKYHTKTNLDSHLAKHTGEKPYECSICNKKFFNKSSASLCMDKHNGVKHHSCPFCNQTFLRREVLKIHIRTHTGEKPFECKICGKRFAQRSPLRIHLKVHEKLGPNYVPRPPRNSKKVASEQDQD